MANAKLNLTVISADGSVEEHSFDQESIILGSGASANVKISDDKVSSIHAMLKVEGPDKVRIIDLGSESGTRFRGKEIREQELGNGDVVDVGSSKVRISFDGAPAGDDAQKTDVIRRPPELDDEEETPAPKAPRKTKRKGPPPPPPAEPMGASDLEAALAPEQETAVTAVDDDAVLDDDDAVLDDDEAGFAEDEDVRAAPDEDDTVPPPSRAASRPRGEGRQITDVVRALPGAGPDNGSAARLFSERLPPEERPQAESRMLEVVMVWADTIIGLGHYTGKDGQVTIGESAKNDFHLANELIHEPRFPFLTAQGEDWSLTVTEGMVLRIRDEDGNVSEMEDLKRSGRLARADAGFRGYSYKLGLHDQAVVSLGDTAFVLRYVRPSKRIAANLWGTVDFYFTKVLSTSFMAHMLFLAALLLTPVHTQQLSEDLFTNPNRFAKMIIQAPKAQPKHKFRRLSGVAEGAKARRKEGKFGKKEAVKKIAAPSKKGAPIVNVNKREQDRKKVMSSGLAAAFNNADPGAASNVFGPGGLGTGINNALGGLHGGAGMGDAHGVGGLGSRGTGPGGGGTALGIGGLGTKGSGHGRGGYGSIDLGGRGRSMTQVTPGTTVVQGGLAKEVIARIVHRHQNEIKYCYEKELQKDPNLYGKVAVTWIISPTGSVVRATLAESTMRNSNVENCILTRVRRWKFPEPKGGGIVQVTYPWIFKSNG